MEPLMKVVTFEKHGDQTEVLKVVEQPSRAPSAGEVPQSAQQRRHAR